MWSHAEHNSGLLTRELPELCWTKWRFFRGTERVIFWFRCVAFFLVDSCSQCTWVWFDDLRYKAPWWNRYGIWGQQPHVVPEGAACSLSAHALVNSRRRLQAAIDAHQLEPPVNHFQSLFKPSSGDMRKRLSAAFERAREVFPPLTSATRCSRLFLSPFCILISRNSPSVGSQHAFLEDFPFFNVMLRRRHIIPHSFDLFASLTRGIALIFRSFLLTIDVFSDSDQRIFLAESAAFSNPLPPSSQAPAFFGCSFSRAICSTDSNFSTDDFCFPNTAMAISSMIPLDVQVAIDSFAQLRSIHLKRLKRLNHRHFIQLFERLLRWPLSYLGALLNAQVRVWKRTETDHRIPDRWHHSNALILRALLENHSITQKNAEAVWVVKRSIEIDHRMICTSDAWSVGEKEMAIRRVKNRASGKKQSWKKKPHIRNRESIDTLAIQRSLEHKCEIKLAVSRFEACHLYWRRPLPCLWVTGWFYSKKNEKTEPQGGNIVEVLELPICPWRKVFVGVFGHAAKGKKNQTNKLEAIWDRLWTPIDLANTRRRLIASTKLGEEISRMKVASVENALLNFALVVLNRAQTSHQTPHFNTHFNKDEQRTESQMASCAGVSTGLPVAKQASFVASQQYYACKSQSFERNRNTRWIKTMWKLIAERFA